MAGRGTKNAQRSRTETERARLHAARTTWHRGEVRRRTRDNAIVGAVGGILVAAAIASQAVHAQVTAPEPSPAPAVSPTPPENPFSSLFPAVSDDSAE